MVAKLVKPTKTPVKPTLGATASPVTNTLPSNIPSDVPSLIPANTLPEIKMATIRTVYCQVASRVYLLLQVINHPLFRIAVSNQQYILPSGEPSESSSLTYEPSFVPNGSVKPTKISVEPTLGASPSSCPSNLPSNVPSDVPSLTPANTLPDQDGNYSNSILPSGGPSVSSSLSNEPSQASLVPVPTGKCLV
jgi:hypothetical protein